MKKQKKSKTLKKSQQWALPAQFDFAPLNVRLVAPGFAPNDGVKEKLKDFTNSSLPFHFHQPRDLWVKHPLNSNTIERRCEHLIEALNDDQADVIWCLRGGYGSLQMLSELELMRKPAKPKMLIGLSDITSLHIFLLEKWGWPSLHGSHLDRWIEHKIPPVVLKELLAVIFKQQKTVVFKKLKALNSAAEKLTKIEATLVGGNLITLTSHLGTAFNLNLKDRFLFIEEIGERAYKIDRCLTQLQLSGQFEGCRGLLIGQMTGCKEPNGKDLTSWLFKTWAQKLDFPVLSGVETGHDVKQRPLPLGCRARLEKISDQIQLTVENNL